MGEIYTTEEYKGFEIKICYDSYPDNPRDWCNIATFVCEHSRYTLGDVQDIESEINDLFYKYVSEEALEAYFCKTRNAKKVEVEDGNGDKYLCYQYTEVWKHDNSEHVIEIPADYYWFDSLSEDLTVSEKLELIEESGEVAMLPISMYEHGGITIWLGSTTDHPDSRWDCSAIGFAYIEKETAEKEMPKDTDDWKKWSYDIMEGEMKIYDQYVRGNVFGFAVEDEDENLIDSCSGYYGTDEIEYMISEAKKTIDDNIEAKDKKHAKNLELVKNNINTLANNSFVISGSVYKIEKDMFDQCMIMAATCHKCRIADFEQVNISSLSSEVIEVFADYIN